MSIKVKKMQVKKISGEVKAIVGKGGQVTIPAGKRKKQGIKEGDLLVFELRECVTEEESKAGGRK